MLSRDDISRLIPHAGTMCLLDRVIEWNADTIVCASRTHGALDNPLRHDGRIGAVCGVEYGLQAMAVHGALIAGARQPVGYLVRLGDVAVSIDFLDELGAELIVRAELVQSLPGGYGYAFSLSAGSPSAVDRAPMISGRATIALVA